jgi:AcrR family transcriptional regulator
MSAQLSIEISPKRQAVIEAAAKLFMAHGYGQVSMDSVAREAGVSKATLYAYFASKDQLFATIVQEGCRDNIVVGLFLPDDATELSDALTSLAGRMLRFLLGPRALAIHRVVIAESVRFPELGRVFYENGPALFQDVFTPWLLRHQAAGRLRRHDPAVAADQFVGLLRSGLFVRAVLGLTPPPTEAEIDATVTAAVTTFLRAYGAV